MSERVDVAGVLAAHESAYGSDDYTRCICGAETINLGGLRGHVADAIIAHLDAPAPGDFRNYRVAYGEMLDRAEAAEAVIERVWGYVDKWEADRLNTAIDKEAAAYCLREALGCPPDALTADLRADETKSVPE